MFGIIMLFGAAGALVATPASLDEVVVTARKTRDAAADVPLALSVVRDAALHPAGVDGLAALAARVAGLSFESFWGGQNAAPVLRGQSQPSTAGDNVGVFVDGVYQASRTGLDVEPLDLARVEVVRGPQSALFGQSTFAGAIHYVPNAPREIAEAGIRIDAGSDAYAGVQGVLSGPLGNSRWRVRLAAGHREADGTRDDAVDGRPLGGFRRDAVALTLASGDAAGGAFASLGARHGRTASEHPPVAALTGTDYDCGARDATSGLWSYRCGELPVATRFAISPGLPDSEQRVSQFALRGALPLGSARLSIDLSGYRAESTAVRDFDSSRAGMPFGVCLAASTCLPTPGTVRLVERLIGIGVVRVEDQRVEQWTQELRLAGRFRDRYDWTLGAFAAQTNDRSGGAFGVDGSALAAGELLAAPLPATPLRVGPPSALNRALVGDPAREQVQQSLTRAERDSVAAFGSLDLTLGDAWSLRTELRWTHERERFDGVLSNFGPGIGRAIPAQAFDDVTPRLSLAWRPRPGTLAWLSTAKGSRSGGVNTTVGLDPGEQLYEPETNWTTELGWRLDDATATRGLRAASLVAFYIDWRDTQIVGFATTPGVNALITRNTAGIVTHGFEATAELAAGESIGVELAYAYADPRFRAGSEDAGSRGFCGLSGASTASSFCTIGPSRTTGDAPGLLVPYVDGNVPNRAPRHTLNVALRLAPTWRPGGWRPTLSVDAGWQDDVYERSIDGAWYGARSLVDARLAFARGAWVIDAWGRNLTDAQYVRAVAARGANFFPTSPRPLDLIHSEGRRYGLGLQYRFEAR
jgi:iron complex outermembrane receptor protein